MADLSIMIYTQIPVVKEEGYKTLDLWAKDLNAQVNEGIAITLLCESVSHAPSGWQGVADLNPAIKVIEIVKGSKSVKDLLSGIKADVLQVPGNMTWGGSRISRQIVNFAKSNRLPVIVGISSNRAKTQILNAVNQNLIRKCIAYAQALSIRLSQFYLTTVSDGTFIVGDGLKHLVSPFCKNLYVGIASWINKDQIKLTKNADFIPSLKLVAAARLDPMKGVHLAVEALRVLNAKGYQNAALDILGEGIEKDNLVKLVQTHSLAEKAKFLGVFAYPSPFLEVLSDYSFVLVTNLNDEQPRIVFDALSRGIIPVCPDRVQFRALGLPPEILFVPGDANDLAVKLEKLSDKNTYHRISALLSGLIYEHTVETMHQKRKDWLLNNLLAKPKTHAV